MMSEEEYKEYLENLAGKIENPPTYEEYKGRYESVKKIVEEETDNN